MNWLVGIQHAIDYIEAHLTEEIDLAAAAREAACSVFYFQRIFGVLCGMPLGEYIRNRRLTLAGNELCTGTEKVIDVALKYGYESPESFSRAFVKFHGISPSEAKKDGSKLKSFARLSVKIILSGGQVMNYRIEEKAAFTVLQKTERHTTDNVKNAISIPQFWSRSHADGTVAQLLAQASDRTFIFGICTGDGAAVDDTFEYAIAAACAPDTPVPNGFEKREIPQRTWAVFECRGAMPHAVQNMMHRIFTEFFPTAAYEPTYEFDIEAYTVGDMSQADYYSEIWVAVAAKN